VAAGRAMQIRDAHYPGRVPIEAYGNGGFRFAGMSHRGSILCLPSGVHGWKQAPTPDAIDEASLFAVLAEADAIEILLVGTGATLVPIAQAVRDRCRLAGIVTEPMATGSAVRTFNVLLAENRAVAAALIAVD
jgi:uncharacterized protein